MFRETAFRFVSGSTLHHRVRAESFAVQMLQHGGGRNVGVSTGSGAVGVFSKNAWSYAAKRIQLDRAGAACE